jgi:predicted DNA-binding transcriptional regulator AlpA
MSSLPTMLTAQAVATMANVAKRTIWRWEACGLMPRGLRLSPRTVRWNSDAIRAWLANLGDNGR